MRTSEKNKYFILEETKYVCPICYENLYTDPTCGFESYFCISKRIIICGRQASAKGKYHYQLQLERDYNLDEYVMKSQESVYTENFWIYNNIYENNSCIQNNYTGLIIHRKGLFLIDSSIERRITNKWNTYVNFS